MYAGDENEYSSYLNFFNPRAAEDDHDDDEYRPAIAVPRNAPVYTLRQVSDNLRAPPDVSIGLEQTGLIFGIDFTESNTWNGFQ